MFTQAIFVQTFLQTARFNAIFVEHEMHLQNECVKLALISVRRIRARFVAAVSQRFQT